MMAAQARCLIVAMVRWRDAADGLLGLPVALLPNRRRRNLCRRKAACRYRGGLGFSCGLAGDARDMLFHVWSGCIGAHCSRGRHCPFADNAQGLQGGSSLSRVGIKIVCVGPAWRIHRRDRAGAHFWLNALST